MKEILGLILLLAAGGYALRKFGLVRPEAARDLNQIILYLFLPPLIFTALHNAHLAWAVAAMPAMGWLAVGAGLLIAYAIGKLLRLSRPLLVTFLLASAMGNTTYLGYPIVRGLYGPAHLTLAILFDLLGSTLAVNTIGMAIAGAASSRGTAPGVIARRLISMPVLWALVLGLATRGIGIPAPLDRLLIRLGDLTVPMSMVTMGLALRITYLRHRWRLVLASAGIKLVAIPLVVWIAARALGLPLAFQQSAVLEGAMPTMFYALNLALFFDLDVPFVLGTIAVSSLLAMATLPLWFWLLGRT